MTININDLENFQNLPASIRSGFEQEKRSHVLVLNELKGYIGELKAKQTKQAKITSATHTKKGVKVGINLGSAQLNGVPDIRGHMLQWVIGVQKLEKVCAFETITIPPVFSHWLDKVSPVVTVQKPDETPKPETAELETVSK